MTAVFSSSSRTSSVALFDDERALLAHGQDESAHRASGVLLFRLDKCLEQTGSNLSDLRFLVADVGPGSFTGVKVAVTIVKSLGFALDLPVGGISAFDLVDPTLAVALPSKKGEYFLRIPGQQPKVTIEPPAGCFTDRVPLARCAGPLLAGITFTTPERLLPIYVAEPSISKPRDPRLLSGPNA